jgi:hypothetical protein
MGVDQALADEIRRGGKLLPSPQCPSDDGETALSS